MKLNNVRVIHNLIIFVLFMTWLFLWVYDSYWTYDVWEYWAYLLAKKVITEKYDKNSECWGNFENNMYPSWSRWKNQDTNDISYWNIQDSHWNYLFSSDNGTCSIIIKIYRTGKIEDKMIDF